MPVDLDGPTPIDPNNSQVQKMLANLQGNILKGHGRDHSVHIFIKLHTDNVEFTRAHLVAVANRIVTSALQQHFETAQFQRFGIPGALFGNLFLTARGYAALGFDEAQIAAAFPEREGDQGVQSNFREGMQAHSNELNDPPVSKWEEGYRSGEIDAMILIADADETFLLRQARALIGDLEKFSTILAVERGNALRTESGEGIEHFGYVDGRSQPIYLTTDLKDEGKTDIWNPVEKLNIVLVPDLNISAEDSFGSYFVFRKLEQDVRRFKIEEERLADHLNLNGPERKRAGALAVGRFEDGTPLTLSQTDGSLPLKENNFTYEHDRVGAQCPFQAHIRKANPRGDTTGNFSPSGDETERSRRITRRGITYGTRNRHPDAFQALEDLPTEGVGLLFMCFQSSIANQFAFIQSIWVNNPDFARPLSVPGSPGAPDTGLDPVIGQGAIAEQHWPLTWGSAAVRDFAFGGFVTLKGGEFFFAPSMPFLKILMPPVNNPRP